MEMSTCSVIDRNESASAVVEPDGEGGSLVERNASDK